MKDSLYTQRCSEHFTLRMPERVKSAIQQKASEEGLSLNSAIIQRLVWSLKNDERMQG
ncbi:MULTISPECIES: Arc family DNA-binding protein [unclassified Photorhabdus]|uniref:Arc family DNA-binding protein n=1 Tax=unclassified Photorhabdus TaxID=2620880 RepID=UPI000DCC326C|nr:MULTISPECIES: Arc family DNA-binding protein [unclassified Photorhabdus]RAW93955.1 Arc family DNA binding domain-containing protein [Photorhabdus sp. S9-53]RAW94047.1 Arc family DNA binding domain-containing protein [Photorhabdus sp. S10-54]RAW97513.1 Arc family DNA binding domain-containing protein [Photorhabdus sp. S8-52]